MEALAQKTGTGGIMSAKKQVEKTGVKSYLQVILSGIIQASVDISPSDRNAVKRVGLDSRKVELLGDGENNC